MRMPSKSVWSDPSPLRSLRVGCTPPHPQLATFRGVFRRRAVDLPQDVSAEHAHLILELAQADALRVAGRADRGHRAHVLRRNRRGVPEDPHGATALAWSG